MKRRIVEQAREIRRQTTAMAHTLPDAQALDSILLFDEWRSFIGSQATVKQRVRHQGILYECIQAHAPQDNWTPDATPALWKRISLDEWPEWVQPTGAHDAYQQGDKVTYRGAHYASLIDGNTWSPDAYPAGWKKVIE